MHQFRILLGLLSLVLVSSWAPSAHMAPRLHSVSSSRKSSFFVTACQSQANPNLDEPSLIEMKDDWIKQVQEMDPDELVEKTVNALVLIACFGFSFYTMLSVDHEITRGWTQQEIAMRIPLDNWASYESALQEKPIITKTFINVVIYCLGDWLSQTVFQSKNVLDFDVKRTLRNGFIGLCFGPLVHMYYEWSDHILPVEGGLFNRLRKILMDQTLYLTIKCSLYIAAVGLLQGDDVETVTDTVKTRIGPICFTAWKFWPLIHCVTYSVIPAQHRMLWVNCVDLVWNAILASLVRVEEAELVPLLAMESEDMELSPVDMELSPVFAAVTGDVEDHQPWLGDPTSSSEGSELLLVEEPTGASENATEAQLV